MTSPVHSPSLYIVAGPNGAGKTTFARVFLPFFADCKQFVNADLIAQGLSPFAPESMALRAGRLMLEQIDLLARERVDFGFETTLSGKSYASWLQRLKGEGYSITLFFLWLPTVDLALSRIKDRVSRGGHAVPEADVRRRFSRGLYNLFHLYRPLLDSWALFENTATVPDIIAYEERGRFQCVSPETFARVQKMGESNG